MSAPTVIITTPAPVTMPGRTADAGEGAAMGGGGRGVFSGGGAAGWSGGGAELVMAPSVQQGRAVDRAHLRPV
jgi:hypothetical protein